MTKLILVLLALIAIGSALPRLESQDFGEMEEQDAPSPRYNCPMVDIDLMGYDVDHFHGIPNWQECGK